MNVTSKGCLAFVASWDCECEVGMMGAVSDLYLKWAGYGGGCHRWHRSDEDLSLRFPERVNLWVGCVVCSCCHSCGRPACENPAHLREVV